MLKKLAHPGKKRASPPPATHVPPAAPMMPLQALQAAGAGSPRSLGQVQVTAAVGSGSPVGAVPCRTVRNSMYRGGLINHSIRDGFGICKWEDGNYYEGEWKGACVRGGSGGCFGG